MLLTRDEFRNAVFKRDNYYCVMKDKHIFTCQIIGQDAHHIIERRLFPDGGYYIDNGATLCSSCHIKAEQTEISCEEIREAAHIKNIILPPHLYRDQRYDKWGNPILPNGQRLKGELFYDESVQKILGTVLSLFTDYTKYPRTWHLPWSPGVGKDDRVLTNLFNLTAGEIVITEKMDGENTTLYHDYMHARSIDYSPHESRGWMKAFHAKICNDIPPGWRICGENLYAKHSIKYENLPSYFLGFSIWNNKNECLGWEETLEWFDLLNIYSVPVLYWGTFLSPKGFNNILKLLNSDNHEGYVVRVARSYYYKEFATCVAKYVREAHVQTHGHWIRQKVEKNQLCQ